MGVWLKLSALYGFYGFTFWLWLNCNLDCKQPDRRYTPRYTIINCPCHLWCHFRGMPQIVTPMKYVMQTVSIRVHWSSRSWCNHAYAEIWLLYRPLKSILKFQCTIKDIFFIIITKMCWIPSDDYIIVYRMKLCQAVAKSTHLFHFVSVWDDL